MAHQLNSEQLTKAPHSTNEAPLDLNLSQKVSQAIFKFHDETEVIISPPKSTGRLPLKSASKIASGVSKLIANGFLGSSLQSGSERTGENEIMRRASSGLDPYEPPQSSNASAEDVNGLHLAGHTPISARKRKISQAGTVVRVQKDLSQSETGTSEDYTTKNILRTPTCSNRKSIQMQQTPDAKKKVILALEANEDEGLPKRRGRPRGSFRHSRDLILFTPHLNKDAHADLVAERRLILEERKVRLAERRFALEERKIEATMEIGKGLIIAMEKMTNVISAMATSSQHG